MAQKTVPLYAKVPQLKPSCDKKETVPMQGEVGDVTVPTLTEFIPARINPAKTAVLILPGGGYTHLAMEKEDYSYASKTIYLLSLLLLPQTWQQHKILNLCPRTPFPEKTPC